MNYFVKAQLISLRRITLLIFTEVIIPNDVVFQLYIEDQKKETLKIIRHTSNLRVNFYELEMSEDYPFGTKCYLYIPQFPLQIIDNSRAIDFNEADQLFSCPEAKLGNFYTPEATSFHVWAPLATSVVLKISRDGDNFESFDLKRGDKGVYALSLLGDYENASYYYLVENNGVTRQARDPYARGTTLDSHYSAVVDLKKVQAIKKIAPSYPVHNLLDCIIYETNVRDFTEDKHTNIKDKGKYGGLVEEKRITDKNNPAGLDYLKYLGITHVQLNPILDFQGVPDQASEKAYNWGYDPISFFAIEGSYSTAPEKPLSRLIEFKNMVEKLHANNIRTIVDVVYNHVYEYFESNLEKLVPGYFFRRKKNGLLCQSSGCGNDFASERPMARKIIVESALNFIDLYDIDGFRFDLMGLLDIKTMKMLQNECLNIKPDLVFYGEGWNMDANLPMEEKACSDNASLLPNYGFFNEMFRDVIKGATFHDKITEKGYINGDISYRFGANFVIHGSVINHSYEPKFVFAHQSINYVECHDNNTLFDKLTFSNSEEDEITLYKRVRLANALVILSFGVPFIHMGQEIGQTKFGLDNTYNKVSVNKMNWEQVDLNFNMVTYLKMIIDLRKNALPYLRLDERKDIEQVFETIPCDNGLLCLYSDKQDYLKNYRKLLILINPTNTNQRFDVDEYYTSLTLTGEDKVYVKNALIPPISINILYLK
ncbi:MAG: type I pullulanase [Bacilli bacterium]